MFLRLKRVAKTFEGNQEVKALKPLSLGLEKGKHLFVIGETGSGKTTLLKCLAGLYDLNEGEIQVEKNLVSGPSQNLIPGHEDIRLVEQDFSLKKFNTVYQNLEMILSATLLKKEKNAKIKSMLDLFGLTRMKNKLPTELSGGQQQRLALAVALIDLPKLLLLDEPFAHFDPQLKGRVFDYLRAKIVEEKVTVVTVTHDYQETLKHADLVLVLNKGRKVQLADPKTCYNSPKNLYSAGLLGEFDCWSVGEKQYLVRPEEIKLSDEKKGIKATMVSNAFCGHFNEITLRKNSGEEYVSYAAPEVNYKIGQQLFIDTSCRNRLINENGTIEYLE